MKYMKLGTRPDTFFTEEATRSVLSSVPSDLTVHINNVRYLLHKDPLVSKCGLLQRLCSDVCDTDDAKIELHEIPGAEESFEICAKFCYGIIINLSAHNFVPAICAAKFLRMTESVQMGNFVLKLEAFFNSCILQGWKDSVVALQTTAKLPEWSANIGIVGRCIDSVVEKILTHPSKAAWSFTYTRPGYTQKHHRSVPKDWWTEDISDLDIDLFRCVIAAVRSSKKLPSPLIGEALHVYACRLLPDMSKRRSYDSTTDQSAEQELVTKQRYVLESIVSLIPTDRESVSGAFLLKLLNVACLLGASPSTKAELVRRSGRKLNEVTVNDLLIFLDKSENGLVYDVDLVGAMLENFLVQFRRRGAPENGATMESMFRVAKLIDGYLQVIARDENLPSSKIIALAESIPGFARLDHDDLYRAIDFYLKEHPILSKTEKKRLCQILDCRKLSTEMSMHAVRNERLPLRVVVQVLFIEQERATRLGAQNQTHQLSIKEIEEPPTEARNMSHQRVPETESHHHRTAESNSKQRPLMSKRREKKDVARGRREIKEETSEVSVEFERVESKAK